MTKKTNTIKTTPEESFDPAILLRDLSDIRLRIEEKKAHAQEIAGAPRPKKEAIDSYSRWIDKQAAEGESHFRQIAGVFLHDSQPHEPLLGRGSKLGKLSQVNITTANSVVAFLLRDELIQAGRKYISSRYRDISLSIPVNEHKDALQTVDAECFALEQTEEKIIEQAEAAGLPVFRRYDMTPEAVLGVGQKESLPWNYDSEIYNRVIRIAAGARAEVDQLRDDLHDAQKDLQSVHSSISNHAKYQGSEKVPKHLADQLASAEAKRLKRQTAYENAYAIVEQRVSLASSLQDYVRKYKREQLVDSSDRVLKPEPTGLVDPLERLGIR
ncbi:MAG: hypothetical protein IH613_02735 [Desulfuromonadales bacterium]|nr:hypothetical protein [Desulfuromonadales bacterium]